MFLTILDTADETKLRMMLGALRQCDRSYTSSQLVSAALYTSSPITDSLRFHSYRGDGTKECSSTIGSDFVSIGFQFVFNNDEY